MDIQIRAQVLEAVLQLPQVRASTLQGVENFEQCLTQHVKVCYDLLERVEQQADKQTAPRGTLHLPKKQ